MISLIKFSLFLFVPQTKDGKHAKHIILELASDHSEQMIAADLYLNTNLLLDDHFIRYQHPNGGEIVKRYGKDNAELCHYQVSALFIQIKISSKQSWLSEIT